jgi:hypothetical protein
VDAGTQQINEDGPAVHHPPQNNETEMDCISEESWINNNKNITNRHDDYIAGSVPPKLRSACPALALFNPILQQNQLVFRTTMPILSSLECQRVLQIVRNYHRQRNSDSGWLMMAAHHGVQSDIPRSKQPMLPWKIFLNYDHGYRTILAERLYPMAATIVPKLADGTTLLTTNTESCNGEAQEHGNHRYRLRVHDAFIVRYDAEHDMSISLPEHSDTSVISFTSGLESTRTRFSRWRNMV